MRLALKFAYNGCNFHGYARQPNLKTAEGEIINLLTKYKFIKDAKESKFRSASRTDRGVSALGNVIAFNTFSSKKEVFQKLKTNKKNILFYGIKIVEPDFYPRYAKLRIYRYYLKKHNLDIDKIISTAALFTGELNFKNFARVEQDKNPVRTIDNIVLNDKKDFYLIDFYAQTFLWHQIRRIISALEKVGNCKLAKEKIKDAILNFDKKVDFGLAPAEPLILKDIIYGFNFEYEKSYLLKLKKLEKQIRY